MAVSLDERSGPPRGRPRAFLPVVIGTVVVLALVVAAVAFLWPRGTIEERISAAAQGALTAAGYADVVVDVTDGDVVLHGLTTGADVQRAVAAVAGLPDVRSVRVGRGPGAPPATPGLGSPPRAVAVSREGDTLVLTGAVGSDDIHTALLDGAAEGVGTGGSALAVVDRLTVERDIAPSDAIAAGAVAGVAGVLTAAVGDGLAVSLMGATNSATVSGAVPDPAGATALVDALRAVLPGYIVSERLTIGAGGVGLPDPGIRAQLQLQIDAILAATPVTFEPDSPQLTPDGQATLARVIGVLHTQPSTRVRVDGYVATGPGGGRFTAEELSQARAATVRDALVVAGVPATAITVQGRGEGAEPAADVAGRRVEITVL